MKKMLAGFFLLLTLLCTLFLTTTVLAASYQINIDPVKNSIFPNERAEFKLTITNFENYDQRFQIYTYSTKWVLRVEPPLNIVPARSQKSFTIFAKPTSTVGYGTEGLAVLIKQLDEGEVSQQNIIIHVMNPNERPGEYRPSVQLNVLTPALIDPREPLDITLNVRNRNALNITQLHVTLDSSLFHDEFTTSLAPLREKSEERTYNLDAHLPKGDYPLDVILSYRNETINRVTKTLHVKEIVDMKQNVRSTSSFFKTVTELEVQNNGNTPQTYEARLPTNWFRDLFTKTTPTASIVKEGGGRYHIWNITLKPTASVVLTTTENYRLLIVLIILFIGGLLTYYLTRSPIIAVKETILTSTGAEEGSSNLKIRIFIKNRSRHALNSVSVIDKVPAIATYTQQEGLGIISPTKVVKSAGKSTILKWELDILEPYEERILSYSLKSKLKIVGKMKLPSAKIHFTTSGGKERVAYTKNVGYREILE